MKYINLIESLLDDNVEKFASIYDPRINGWVTKNYLKGYKSPRDYDDISKWVSALNPNISKYDFDGALKQARNYLKNNRKNEFNKNAELNYDNVIMDFDDGSKWVDIEVEDLNNLINRLQFDCHDELSYVHDKNENCWALIDAQNNIKCIMYKDQYGYNALGSYGNKPNNPKEIKALCVRKGIDLIPDAFTDIGIISAVKSKQIDISKIRDLRSFLDRMSAEDIVDCGLVNYCHHAKINKIYDIYKICKYHCLLLYCLSYLICHNQMNTKAYDIVIQACNDNSKIKSILSKININDNRIYLELMDKMATQISNLEHKAR